MWATGYLCPIRYPTYTSVSALMRANIIPYDLLENDHWQPDFEALEEMDLSGVKLMWVNYPNMPTGANASRELFEKLVAFGKKHRIVICHDNPYSFILNDRPMSILSVDGAKDICIELNSMSKAHNMPGWRMGMLASNTQFVKWVLREKAISTAVSSSPCRWLRLQRCRTLRNGMRG